MPELLLELLSEEIPARMQTRAAEELCAGLRRVLAPLMAETPRGLCGPRRLAAVGEVAARAEAAGKEERGPRIGAPDAAIEGFLRKHGATRDALTQEGAFWVLAKPGAVIEARDLIARELPALLRGFPWPKSMRWGESDFAWVRPLQRILCVFDGEAVRFDLGAHGIVADDLTEGHRVLAGTEPFAVRSFAEYQTGLRERFVVLDAAERERLIEEGIAALATAEGLEVVPDRGLLAEVAGLVEWPVPLLGRIDETFMDLPPEVMRTTMRVNQRYFALRHVEDGRAAARFALVANIAAPDGGAAIVAGNERVLRARLSDARFFWDQDRKQSLDSFLPKLDDVVFHAKLGTQGQRVRRLEALSREIAPMVGADAELAARAARLAKADLASGMVGEFPELQGVMGRYYALASGEDARVADAIGAHYRPLGPGDAVPSEPVAIAVALADKLDQLAAFFAIDERPTGSGDPFALRRAALGIIRVIREGGFRLQLGALLGEASDRAGLSIARVLGDELCSARDQFGQLLGHEPADRDYATHPVHHDQVRPIIAFLAERLRVQLRAEGARHDVVAAVFGATPDDDLVRLLARADALRALLESADGANLLAAYRRAANILRIEEKRDGRAFAPETDAALLTAPEERALAAALDEAVPTAAARTAAQDFAGAMAALATLRAPVDAFFDRVTVNDPDPALRINRLGLLARLRAAMDAVADLSKIEG
jgi:glycyl-tRNA synthetase beta chain